MWTCMSFHQFIQEAIRQHDSYVESDSLVSVQYSLKRGLRGYRGYNEAIRSTPLPV